MSAPLSITILDLHPGCDSPIFAAPLADSLGYAGYWLTEHIAPGGAHGSATMMSALVAGLTEHLRVGTAGILLNHRAPASAAMDFRLASLMFADRFDAGFCGGAAHATYRSILNEELADQSYVERVDRLVGFSRGIAANGERLSWPPVDAPAPRLWYHGGSVRSAEHAARLSVSYGYALHFQQCVDDPAPLRAYARSFVPSEFQSAPSACLAVAGYCSDSARDVAQVLGSALVNPYLVPRVVGSPEQCADTLRSLAERYGVDHIAFCPVAPSTEAIGRCLEALADGLGLSPPLAEAA